MKKLTQSEVIDRFRDIHGNSYDYSLVDYKNKRSKVTLVCPVHGEFRITPDRVLFQCAGCPKCDLIQSVRYPSMLHAFRIEQSIHSRLRKFRYIPKIKFGGYTECFTEINL